MKIEGNRPQDAVTTGRVEGTPAERPATTGRPADPSGDRVQLSSDAQLATAAAAAAASAPIRHDKVEQARKALQAGTVGADAARLADKMIDSLLGK